MEHPVFYFTHQMAKHFNTTTTTMYRWSEALEEQGYKFKLDDRGQRAYRDIDIEAMAMFVELKDVNRMRVDTAARQVVDKFKDRVEMDIELLGKRKANVDLPADPEEFKRLMESMAHTYREVLNQNQILFEELKSTRTELEELKGSLRLLPGDVHSTQQQLSEMREEIKLLPESVHATQHQLSEMRDELSQIGELKQALEEVATASTQNNEAEMRTMIRTVQFDIRMAELEVTNRLKKQAQDEWNRLPEGERYRKKGFFGKEEDLGKRELFVQRYIEDNLANEMAKTKER
ncbi:hypothetical protein EEL30_00775 (plasmid) [Brevibacillus laterosporus]|uniref:HTH merR-type domain-containing protein n=1 Tax=Brevibacillus laterosporus TaxID=1465 RepID=A0A518V223_BRELA|nr:hypothetical protein EEL30_00775 [Brevibacillus laterosporus]